MKFNEIVTLISTRPNGERNVILLVSICMSVLPLVLFVSASYLLNRYAETIGTHSRRRTELMVRMAFFKTKVIMSQRSCDLFRVRSVVLNQLKDLEEACHKC